MTKRIFAKINKNQFDTSIQHITRLEWMNKNMNDVDIEKYNSDKDYYDSLPFNGFQNSFGELARKEEQRIIKYDNLKKETEFIKQKKYQELLKKQFEKENDEKEGKLPRDLMFQYRRIATIKIETLDTSKFIIGSFFIYFRNKKCYFTEQNQELFFNKMFNFTKNFRTKIVCFFQSKNFNTKFLMKYCSKNLEELPKIEKFNKEILQIQIPEYNITFKDIELFLKLFPDKFEYTENGKIAHIINSDYISIFRTKIHKINLKYNILDMLNSRNNSLELKGFELLKEKIEFDTVEMYKGIIPHHLNSYLFVGFKEKYTKIPFAEIEEKL